MANPLIRYAVASAIAAAAASTAVHATDLSTYSTSGRTNVVVYISGSTAVDNTLLSDVESFMCQPGTTDTYSDSTSTTLGIGGGFENLAYCQAASASGLPTSDFLVVEKESTAGSINGAQPLIAVAKGQASGLHFWDPNQGVAIDACAKHNGGWSTAGTCTSSTLFQSNVVPTGGVADVEAGLLYTVGVPTPGPLSKSDISNFLSAPAPGVDVVWGLGVTKNLYYALQTQEGMASKCPLGSGGTTNFDSPTCAPSLSKEQVAAIFLSANDFNTAQLLSWNQIVGMNNPSGDNNIYLCRRDYGSGTEASWEAYFLGARCGSSSLSMSLQSPPFVVEAASTGGIRTCLQAFDQGNIKLTPYNGDTTPAGTFAPFTPAGNQWAVGLLTTELTAANLTAANDAYRIVAIDGVLPTLENVINGFDPYFSTDAWYTWVGEPSSPAKTVFTNLQLNIGNPTIVKASDQTYKNQPWGDGGDLSPASLFAAGGDPYAAAGDRTAGGAVTAAAALSVGINVWTKAASGAVNNCDTPVLYSDGTNTYVTPSQGQLLGTGNVNQ